MENSNLLLIKPVMFGFITNCFKNLKLINIYLKYSKLTKSLNKFEISILIQVLKTLISTVLHRRLRK